MDARRGVYAARPPWRMYRMYRMYPETAFLIAPARVRIRGVYRGMYRGTCPGTALGACGGLINATQSNMVAHGFRADFPGLRGLVPFKAVGTPPSPGSVLATP